MKIAALCLTVIAAMCYFGSIDRFATGCIACGAAVAWGLDYFGGPPNGEETWPPRSFAGHV